jgi:hypothetical protein
LPNHHSHVCLSYMFTKPKIEGSPIWLVSP